MCLAQLVLQGGRKGVGRGKRGHRLTMVRRWFEDGSKMNRRKKKRDSLNILKKSRGNYINLIEND